jgi:drug/metabolite transporter (DMT)-like permease
LESNLDLGYFSIGTVTTSLFIMILSIITGLDTITRFQILGFTIVLSGFLLMFCENSQDTSKIAGLSYLLASNISISIGTVLLKKFNVAPTFTNISWMSLFSALFLLFTSVLENGIAKINYDISHLSIHSLMTILFSSYMITLLSGKMWVQVVRYFSPIMSSFSLFLTPIFSFLLASVFLKEITDYNKCISLILILFGILIATEIKVYPKKV